MTAATTRYRGLKIDGFGRRPFLFTYAAREIPQRPQRAYTK